MHARSIRKLLSATSMRALGWWRRPRRPAARKARLAVEALEDRTLMTINVPTFLMPSAVGEGDAVGFYAEAQGGSGQLTYTWDFGDGTTASGVDLRAPSHMYDTNSPPGTPYTVTLTVTDGTTSASRTGGILVANVAPVAVAGPGRKALEGAPVAFNGQASDAGTSGDIQAIEWDFDYRGTFTADVVGSLTPSHTYAAPGLYTVALRVTDRAGEVTVDYTSVDVEHAGGVVVDAGADTSARVGSPVTFSGSYGGSASLADVAWDFNYDGSRFDAMATGTLAPTYTFTTPGTYQVAMRVVCGVCGRGEVDVLTVRVAYAGPKATAGPDRTVNAGETVLFSGGYTDPDGAVAPEGVAWDFNYDLVNGVFTPDVTGTLTPSWQFSSPGGYIVALQVTDEHGASDISFLGVTVNPSTPYVNAGPDRTIAAGDSTTFLGSARMAGSVAPEGIEWDFDYGYMTFDPDPSATGMLTPTKRFDTPGTYQVALRVTDGTGVSRIDTATVTVSNARPAVTVGPAVTVTQGGAAAFSASVSCPDPVRIEWDFHYEDGSFMPYYEANDQLAPSFQYTAAGTYLAAVRVTNTVGGAATIREVIVNVTNVAPTATVTHSGPTPEGSNVTFTVSGLTDPNSAATFGFEADWTGSGEFEFIPQSRRTVNPMTGAVSFTRRFDDNGTYTVTIRLSDREGDYTDYVQTVVVQNAAPAVSSIAPVGGDAGSVGPGVPIRFSVAEPSLADEVAGFAYYYSIGGGPFVEAPSGEFYLPTPSGGYGMHTVRGYVRDKDGGVSAVYERTISVGSSNTVFQNGGGGSVRLGWSGGSVVLAPGASHYLPGTVGGLTVTLLTSGATYILSTNSSIEVLDYAAGVTGVDVRVSTTASTSLPPVVGDGHIGTIHLPGGNATRSSRLNVSARGDLGNVIGPSGSGRL